MSYVQCIVHKINVMKRCSVVISETHSLTVYIIWLTVLVLQNYAIEYPAHSYLSTLFYKAIHILLITIRSHDKPVLRQGSMSMYAHVSVI